MRGFKKLAGKIFAENRNQQRETWLVHHLKADAINEKDKEVILKAIKLSKPSA